MLDTLRIITDNLPAFVQGIEVTWATTVVTIIAGSVLGILVAVGSLYLKAAHSLFRAYVEVLLGLPVLVLLVWIYYVLPTITPFLTLPPYSVGILGLSLSLSAFVAEIVEGGIRSVPRGQVEAAYLLGVGRLQAVRYIVLPQAIKTMWPALVVQYITTYKFSTLVSVIGVQDILHVGSQVVAQTYRILEVYTFIAIFFIVTIVPLNVLARRLSKTRPYDLLRQL
jgi:polar amino acid transport system permease protein